MNLVYVLILTTYMTGKYNDVPTVAQTVIPGFTTEQACKNAGRVAQNGAPANLGRYDNYAVVTYQCSPLNL